ncbi:hypothetical protein L3Q82_009144 [Scortum barcoo]|uniref:Uncharacterized protein n=1 Tax=Scortum barcoo TaxID=214431 RepID=A0ACB8XA67_9TELE|nr:hypothetical protein L3Q82_009144 [Scortum barcoo]
MKDPTHTAHALFVPLPSGRRLRSIKSRTTRLRNSFFPEAVRLLNSGGPLMESGHHEFPEQLQCLLPSLLKSVGVSAFNTVIPDKLDTEAPQPGTALIAVPLDQGLPSPTGLRCSPEPRLPSALDLFQEHWVVVPSQLPGQHSFLVPSVRNRRLQQSAVPELQLVPVPVSELPLAHPPEDLGSFLPLGCPPQVSYST